MTEDERVSDREKESWITCIATPISHNIYDISLTPYNYFLHGVTMLGIDWVRGKMIIRRRDNDNDHDQDKMNLSNGFCDNTQGELSIYLLHDYGLLFIMKHEYNCEG